MLFLSESPKLAAILRTKNSLRSYLISQIVCSTGCALGDRYFGWQSDPYRFIFIVLTLPVLAMSLILVWQAGARWSLIVAAMAAIIAGVATYHEYAGYMSADFLITTSEGCALVFLGLGMAFRAPFAEDLTLPILSVLWIFLAIYDFHFLLNTKMPVLDYVAPIWLVDSACLAIAFTRHAPQMKEASSLR